MRSDRASPWLKLTAIMGLVFLQLPLIFLVVEAFSINSTGYEFPPKGFTSDGFFAAWADPVIWRAMWLSFQVAFFSTCIGCVLGVLCAAILSRMQFFGRKAVSLLFVLPVALPSAVIGISLQSVLDISPLSYGFWTMLVGQTTFCILVVCNNVVAHFRLVSKNLAYASLDLGANLFQTFWYAILPAVSGTILAGILLAFVLSFNEVLVTSFTAGTQTTLPLWMFDELSQSNPTGASRVMIAATMIVSFIPIFIATLLLHAKAHRH